MLNQELIQKEFGFLEGNIFLNVSQVCMPPVRVQEAYGKFMDDYVKMMGGDMSKLRESLRPMAENTVKANVMIAAVVEAEKIEVTDEEVEAELAKFAEQFKMEVAQVKEYLPMENVKSDLCYRKAVKMIADSAVVVAPAQEG